MEVIDKWRQNAISRKRTIFPMRCLIKILRLKKKNLKVITKHKQQRCKIFFKKRRTLIKTLFKTTKAKWKPEREETETMNIKQL